MIPLKDVTPEIGGLQVSSDALLGKWTDSALKVVPGTHNDETQEYLQKTYRGGSDWIELWSDDKHMGQVKMKRHYETRAHVTGTGSLGRSQGW